MRQELIELADTYRQAGDALRRTCTAPSPPLTGKHPRNFAISPDGRFLLCACRDDNRIEVYSINNLSGELTPTGKSIEVGSPVCIQFLEQ